MLTFIPRSFSDGCACILKSGLFQGECAVSCESDLKKPEAGHLFSDLKKTGMAKESASLITSILKDSFNCKDQNCNGGGVERFVDEVNPAAYSGSKQVGAQNVGLARFFEEKIDQSDSRCFAGLVYRFYQDQGNELRRVTDGNSNLDTVSQQGLVWKKAFKLAGGDANLALALIGVCGHDDMVESDLSYCVDREDAKLVSWADPKACALSKTLSKEGLFALHFDCPGTGTKFHTPGGLGGTSALPVVGIPDETKKRIAAMEGGDIALLPHKYYHVYASAYLTCQMIGDGIPIAEAENMERATAMLYRSVRICSNAQKNIENFNKMLPALGLAPIDATNSERLKAQWAEINDQGIDKITHYLSSHPAALSSLGLESIANLSEESVKTDKIKAYIGFVLAGHMTKNFGNLDLNKIKTKTADQTAELNVLKNLKDKIEDSDGVQFMMKVASMSSQAADDFQKIIPCMRNSLANYWFKSELKSEFDCKGQSGCAAAKAKLRSYEGDFYQTESYHRLGEQFASKACKPSKASEGSKVFTDRACAALKKLRQGPNSESGPQHPSVSAPSGHS